MIRFSREDSTRLSQSEAFFHLLEDGETKRIKLHDYDAIYAARAFTSLFYERAIDGEWLDYCALVARKHGPLPIAHRLQRTGCRSRRSE